MTLQQISSDDITFHSLSFTDWNGRVFKWKGDLYRAIPPQQSALYRNLFEQGIVKQWIENKLFIETELTNFKIESYDMVIKHRLLPFVSYAQEWCDLMLKDAALLHLDFCLELDRYDLTTGDAHPLNILFDGCRPIFLDLGSINYYPVEASSHAWHPYEQFCHFFLYPLYLMDRGHGRIARWLLHDYEKGVQLPDFKALTQSPLSLTKETIKKIQSVAKLILKKNLFARQPHPLRRTSLKEIKKEVESIALNSFVNKIADPPRNFLFSSELFISQSQVIEKVISELKPQSILDIRSSSYQGYYTQLSTRYSPHVVAFDPDEIQVKQLYLKAKHHNWSVTPAIVDFVSPSYGLSNDWLAPIGERLRCELVLALGFLDQLVFNDCIRFDKIVSQLSRFSEHTLLVEFIPREFPFKNNWSLQKASCFSWYSLENFIKELNRYFRQINLIESYPQPNLLFLCKK